MNRNEPLNRGKKKNIDSENIQAQKTGIIGSKQRKKKLLCNNKINQARLLKKISYGSKQEIKVQDM